MNTDDVKYKIEVMQVYLEGKTIQVKASYDNEWENLDLARGESFNIV